MKKKLSVFSRLHGKSMLDIFELLQNNSISLPESVFYGISNIVYLSQSHIFKLACDELTVNKYDIFIKYNGYNEVEVIDVSEYRVMVRYVTSNKTDIIWRDEFLTLFAKYGE